jgi:hypothetical protein
MLIDITINNRLVKIRASASVLQACEEVGFSIPRFCYHEHLSVAGNCRMCLVEIQKSPKPVVSCAMPISKGMIIFTETPLVKKAREAVLEFLLINHPLDCPICDQGGECDLQDETLQYATDRGRYYEFKRSVEDKECGPIIKTIMTRCIHCTRCIRFSSEIAGQETLGSFGRGQDTEIGTYIQHFIKTELSGNLVDLCPVGALTSKPYAYAGRNWELQQVDTIDFFDSMCSDIVVHSRLMSEAQLKKYNVKIITKDTILRILPKVNGIYMENWISDRTRYAFDGLKNNRLKCDEVEWETTMTNILHRLESHGYFAIAIESIYKNRYKYKYRSHLFDWYKKPIDLFLINRHKNTEKFNLTTTGRVGVVVGSLCDIQGLYFLYQFIKLMGHTDFHVGNVFLKHNYDYSFFYSFNRTIESLCSLDTLLMIGTNTRFEVSLLNTILRKYQLQKALTYITLGTYSNLNLKQKHEGNSLRSLIAYAENRIQTGLVGYTNKQASIFYSFENNKLKNGYLLQNIIRFLGKKFFTKTRSGSRLGIIHSSITTLNVANLGISAGVRSPLYTEFHEDKQIGTLFAVQMQQLKPKKWLSSKIYTHTINVATNNNTTSFSYDNVIPIQSLYEKNGYSYNIENRLRKFTKAVTAPKTARSLEAFVGVLSKFLIGGPATWKSMWNFEDEVDFKTQYEKVLPILFFNPFQWNENEKKGSLFTFAPNITNFYLNDIISTNSATMGECSLFFEEVVYNSLVQDV